MRHIELSPKDWEALRQLGRGTGRWLLHSEELQPLIQLGLAEERAGGIVISRNGQAALERQRKR